MIVTEQQARELRCCGPQTCGVLGDVQRFFNGGNGPVQNLPLRFCVGAACMAWLWADDKADRGCCGLAEIPMPAAVTITAKTIDGGTK